MFVDTVGDTYNLEIDGAWYHVTVENRQWTGVTYTQRLALVNYLLSPLKFTKKYAQSGPNWNALAIINGTIMKTMIIQKELVRVPVQPSLLEGVESSMSQERW